jgi:dTDP-4-amino-4,6-dideoxygalactose transaminase
LGINGKNSEFHAAMGLCNLPWVEKIIQKRKNISEKYNTELNFGNNLSKPQSVLDFEYNYAYYPVLFSSEKKLLEARELLRSNQINTRRYFFPSLNNLPFIEKQKCPISENISSRVLALPIFYDLEEKDIIRISKLINSIL